MLGPSISCANAAHLPIPAHLLHAGTRRSVSRAQKQHTVLRPSPSRFNNVCPILLLSRPRTEKGKLFMSPSSHLSSPCILAEPGGALCTSNDRAKPGHYLAAWQCILRAIACTGYSAAPFVVCLTNPPAQLCTLQHALPFWVPSGCH